MKRTLVLTLLSFSLISAPRKPLPGQAGNDNIELVGNVVIDREEIKQLVGMDLGAGFVVVKMQVTPKMDTPLAVGPGDFTIISAKDGQRSQGLEPGEIAGSGVLVLKEAPQKSWASPGTTLNGPEWAGVTPRTKSTSNTEVRTNGSDKPKNPLLEALTAKVLPDTQTKDPVEGLLYFTIDGKIKAKDLRVQYKGPAGRLMMEFAESK